MQFMWRLNGMTQLNAFNKENRKEPILEVRNVKKSFGAVKAIKKADLTLCSGEIHALVGGNGAGKSTLVSIICGDTKADTGDIFIDGKKVKISNPRVAQNHGIGTVHQNLALVNQLDVTANLFLGNEILMKPPFRWLGIMNLRKMRKQADDEIKNLKLNIDSVDRIVDRMSGGQRQGIACARAVRCDAKVLIMDEPTAALGVSETATVKALMKRFRDAGAAILLISHNMEDVFELADKITVMRLGNSITTVHTKDVTPEQIVGLITGAVNNVQKDE